MRTRFIQIPDGGIAVFDRPREGFVYVFEFTTHEGGGFWKETRQRTVCVSLDWFLNAYTGDNRAVHWARAKSFMACAIRDIRCPDAGVLTLVHRGPMLGLIFSQEIVCRQRRGRPWPYASDRPPKWWAVTV